MKPLNLIIFSTFLISPFSFAENNVKHTLGATASAYGFFNFETNSIEGPTSGISMEQDIYYRYMLNEYIGIENGFMLGGGGLIQDVQGDKHNGDIRNRYYFGFRSALYAQYPLIKKLYLYTKVGGALIQSRYSINENKFKLENKGLYGALGMKYKFTSGWSIDIEHKRITGGDFESHTYAIGTSYSF